MLSIIILNYNTKEETYRCFQSIQDYYTKERIEGLIEVIIVDNNSTDNSALFFDQLAKKNKHTLFVKNEQNFGFSKGNNIGVKHTRGEYLLFLNSDTQVCGQSILTMLSFLEKQKDIGVVGGILKSNDGSIQNSGGSFYSVSNTLTSLFFGERSFLKKKYEKSPQHIDWVSGACMLIKKDLFHKLGGFDENIFMYVEDMELCYRIKQLGYINWLFPECNVIHTNQGSSNRTFAIVHIYKGIRYFYKKHKNIVEYGIVTMALILKAISAIIWGFITNNKYLITTYKQAL